MNPETKDVAVVAFPVSHEKVSQRKATAGPGFVRAVVSREGDRVTTLELFFDLAFVFAFTQLSRLMAQQHDALGIVQALVILVLLWWSWTAYGWLSNLAHADEGVVRIAMIIGMTAMFVAGLVVLEAYDDLPGGLFGPLVFVAAYLGARITHGIVFVWLSEPGLRRRTAITVGLSVVPSGALLTAGALLGEPWQIWCALAAVAIEPIVSRRTSAGIDWPVRSTAHFTERHGLVVILALGESILAIGAGVATQPMNTSILVGVVLSMLICVALWWAYFARLARAAEHALAGRVSGERGRLATDSYTYLHLLLVSGIVLAALGLEVAMAHIDQAEPFGLFGAAALGGGVACFLSGSAFFARRLLGQWNRVRLAFATLLVLAVPGIALLPPVAALASVAGLLLVVLAVDRMRLAPRPV
ncbi:low temperature requirement protein A [Herbiconiux sp. P16]|uniref:low temperature requirement protein A n=1 Tax=Herbiconiux wuyangfengii TaxID=3342794 RepID=UPI0035B701C4